MSPQPLHYEEELPYKPEPVYKPEVVRPAFHYSSPNYRPPIQSKPTLHSTHDIISAPPPHAPADHHALHPPPSPHRQPSGNKEPLPFIHFGGKPQKDGPAGHQAGEEEYDFLAPDFNSPTEFGPESFLSFTQPGRQDGAR